MNTWNHLATTLGSILLLCGQVDGAYQIESSAECDTCEMDGSVSCRQTYYDRYAFCCDPSEVGTRSCGGEDVYCSTDPVSMFLKNTFSCPYD